MVRGQDLAGRADGPECRRRDRRVGAGPFSCDLSERGGGHDQEPAVEVCASPLLALTEPAEEKLLAEVSELELVVESALDTPVVLSVVVLSVVVLSVVVAVEVATVVDVEWAASW